MKKALLIGLLAMLSWPLSAQNSAQYIQQAQRHQARLEYKEAFEALSNANAAAWKEVQASGKERPELFYSIYRQRVQLYIQLKNFKKAKEYLARMENHAKDLKNDSIDNDLLYSKAQVYYTFGSSAKGNECINQLVDKYKEQENYKAVNDCYQHLISLATRTGSANMTANAYKQYMLWNDSLTALNTQKDRQVLQSKYEESLKTIEEKDDTLNTKQYIILALCVLVVALAAALIVGGIVLIRFMVLTRKQKKDIETANEHNELKNKFIQHIATQMEPTLRRMDKTLDGVKAIRTFLAHIQEFTSLENSQEEGYELSEEHINLFCEEVVRGITDQTKPEVVINVNAPKISAKICKEPLQQVLTHLLKNAAEYTPEGGHITLEYKKRGAHTHQILVSDSGCSIDEALRDKIFKPFNQIKDLNEGDGFGLPICALMAKKMNGSLTLDDSYTKGTRFILDLHV